jgi:hypothetical protein
VYVKHNIERFPITIVAVAKQKVLNIVCVHVLAEAAPRLARFSRNATGQKRKVEAACFYCIIIHSDSLLVLNHPAVRFPARIKGCYVMPPDQIRTSFCVHCDLAILVDLCLPSNVMILSPGVVNS